MSFEASNLPMLLKEIFSLVPIGFIPVPVPGMTVSCRFFPATPLTVYEILIEILVGNVYQYMGLSENSVPLHPMVLLIIIPIKWLFHWEYTQFSDKPIWDPDRNSGW